MWAKCMGLSKRKQQKIINVVHVLDYSNQSLAEFPKLARKDFNITTGLIFDNNNFGALPNQLFEITNLRKISFQENNLEFISADISKLPLLEDVNFAKNDLNDICDEISLCTKIKKLDLSNNVLLVIKDCICSLSNLETLLFNDTSLNEIPDNISELKRLVVLEARDNFISIIPDGIGELTLLKRIDIGCNEITIIPTSIQFLSHLEELYLDSNSLMAVPSDIKLCTKLQILDLSSNAIGFLPDEFGCLENLNELILSNNHLVALPDSLGNLKSLKTLRLEDNMLDQLPDSICKLQNLEDLYLKNNALKCLPEKIGVLQSLSVLYLDNNQIKALPDSICECKRLKILSLNTNYLKLLPRHIGSMQMLSIIDLSNNKLEYLPYSISQLNLRALWLCPGQIKPTISLQYTTHPTEGNIITCYLLPQSITKAMVRKSLLTSRKSSSSISNTSDDFTNETTSELSSSNKKVSSSSKKDKSSSSPKREKLRVNAESTKSSHNEDNNNNNNSNHSNNNNSFSNGDEPSFESNVFSDMSDTGTLESFSSANNYRSISTSSEDEAEIRKPDEFMSVTQDYALLPQFKIDDRHSKSNGSRNSYTQSEADTENMVKIQMSLKKENEFVVARDSLNELTFVDYINPIYSKAQRGDVIAMINSIPAKKFSLEKIKALIRNSVQNNVILEITLEKYNVPENSTIIENKQTIDFETRVVCIESMEMTDFGALPIYFEGGANAHILPFGNMQSPILVSFVDMDLIKATSNIFEGDRVIEVNNIPLNEELKESVALSQFFFKNRNVIRSVTVRNDPPEKYFFNVTVHKNNESTGFSMNGGYYYNGALKPNYISSIEPNCTISNGNYISVGMWILEINGIFVLHRRHNELVQIIDRYEDNFSMVVFDVESRSKNLDLSGVLSSIPCTLDIINKYDTMERYRV